MSIVPDRGAELLALYDLALPRVYGYLLARCSDRAVAEDLTSEVFLAAYSAPGDGPHTAGWLLGIARYKLIDHWRWKARQDRLVDATTPLTEAEDTWEEHLDVLQARQVLARLGPNHRAALTLRYLDGLSVPETAAVLQRTVHATEALLVRARRAFRADYLEGSHV